MYDDRSFGMVIEGVNPTTIDSDSIRRLLSVHGVIAFRGIRLTHADQVAVMSLLGTVQNWMEQQAMYSYTDTTDKRVILLDNDDFLGKSRMGWHMDQIYLKSDYLPIRSLYCTYVDSENITEFVDIAYLTSQVIEFCSITDDTNARYYIDSAKTKFSQRSVFSDCSHVGKKLLRYDERMEFIDRSDSIAFKDFCRSILNSNEIPRLAIKWQVDDFVIFDNNQCPHRRSVMNGDCRLSRLTSTFWLSS